MQSSLPVLYSFRRCPYAIRARLALRYSGIRCELREVVLRDKPAEMLAVSTKGTVPVLITNSGPQQEVIDESLDIMVWALAQSDPDAWLDVDPAAAHALITGNDEDFKVWLDRYKYPDRYSDIGDAQPREECGRFLAELDGRLNRSKWLAGDALTMVDMAIFPFVRQFAFTDIDWFRSGVYPELNDWLDRLLGGELFSEVMGKYPAWEPGDEVVEF